jgi:hypothetical protein
MFCAGLLLSIADLLKFFELRATNLHLSAFAAGQAQNNSTFLTAFRLRNTGGQILPSRRHVSEAAPPSR